MEQRLHKELQIIKDLCPEYPKHLLEIFNNSG